MRRSTRLSFAMICASAFAGSGAVAADGDDGGKRLLDIASHACFATPIEGQADAKFKPVAIGENEEIDAIRDYWEQGAKRQHARMTQFEVAETMLGSQKLYVLATKLEGRGSITRGCRTLIPGSSRHITTEAFSQWAGTPAKESYGILMRNERRWDAAPWRDSDAHVSMSFFDSTTKLPEHAPRFPFHGTIIQFSSAEISDEISTAILKD